MMNDVDLTDSTQKRLQWDAEDTGANFTAQTIIIN